MLRIPSCVFALAFLAMASNALGNGRPPQTVGVFVQSGNDQTVLVSTTFGLLISRDGGTSFQWVCEDAVGYGGVFDPDFAIASDGTIFAATDKALRISRDDGCTWSPATGALGDNWVDDIEIGPAGAIWAITATTAAANDVYRSTDNGLTFDPRNMRNDTAFWKSIRIAPSDGQRVYLTGYELVEGTTDGGLTRPSPLLFRSIDGGDSWTPLDYEGIELADLPLFKLLAVDPDDPGVVFGRSVNANGLQGDILYRSGDAGDTWTEVLRTETSIRAFVLRKNGQVIAGTTNNGASDDRVFVSSDGIAPFAKATSQLQMACITELSTGDLLACGANWEPDFLALGRSSDGNEWTKLVRFSEIQSAYQCPAETIQAEVCEAIQWPALCLQFGCERPVIQPDAGPGPPDRNTGGCCDAGASPASTILLVVFAGLVLAVVLRRRRTGAQATRD